MVDAPRTLPDLDALDPAAMKAMIADQHAMIEHLKLVIAKLRRMQFGRKSEKVDRQIEQFELQLEDLEASCAEPVPQPVSAHSPKTAPSAAGKRRSLPEHLRREVHTHLSGHKACPECGGTLKKLGEDISEMLDLSAGAKIGHRAPRERCFAAG